MIDQESEAFKAAWRALWPDWLADGSTGARSGVMANRDTLTAALEAYEAARPKSTHITGLPETLPDGRRIVGWRFDRPSVGAHIYEVDLQDFARATDLDTRFAALIAITEADNG